MSECSIRSTVVAIFLLVAYTLEKVTPGTKVLPSQRNTKQKQKEKKKLCHTKFKESRPKSFRLVALFNIFPIAPLHMRNKSPVAFFMLDCAWLVRLSIFFRVGSCIVIVIVRQHQKETEKESEKKKKKKRSKLANERDGLITLSLPDSYFRSKRHGMAMTMEMGKIQVRFLFVAWLHRFFSFCFLLFTWTRLEGWGGELFFA